MTMLPELPPSPFDFLKRLIGEGPPSPPNPFLRRSNVRETPAREAHREVFRERPQETSRVTTLETIAYQNREISKVLLALETHLNQGCKIAGKACDCCSPKHPLELEKLSEEALTMTSNIVYHDIIAFAHEVERKASVSAVESGEYESEYQALAIRARDLRKRIAALNEGQYKAEAALGMIRRGEMKID